MSRIINPNSEELVKAQEMRIRSEFQYFRSLGYRPNCDEHKVKGFLSAEKADELLKIFYK